MRSFLDKIFLRSNNLDNVSQNIKKLTEKTPAQKILTHSRIISQDLN